MIENRLRIHLGSIAVLYVMAALQSTGLSAQTSIKTDMSWGRTAATLTPSASNTTVTRNQGALAFCLPVPRAIGYRNCEIGIGTSKRIETEIPTE